MSSPEPLSETLQNFRQTHPARSVRAGGDDWEYLIGGSGRITIVLIGGGGSTAESMFAVNVALEHDFRVVSVTIPATAARTGPVIDGILAVVDAIEIDRAVFLGHSLGGLVIQAFAARHFKRVSGLVLSNSAIYVGARKRLMPMAAAVMKHIPESLAIRMVMSQMDRLLRTADAAEFWKSFYREESAKPGAAARLKTQLALLGQFAVLLREHPIPAAADWAARAPVQIICSEDDRGFTRQEIAHLAQIYPRASTATFPPGTGHLSFLTRPREYVEIVRQFAAGLPEAET